MHSIQRRHFSETAQKVGYAPSAEPIIEELLARTPAATAEVRAGPPQDISPRVVDAILGGLEQAVVVLEGMAAS
jgi:serine/threonine-protein kinase HipA